MKKALLILISAAALANVLPVSGTISYLTSARDYATPISFGTNDDIFQTETTSFYLETKVKKKTSVKKEKQKDGKTKESKQEKTSVSLGSQVIVMLPQREGLNLNPSNFRVTGFPAGAIKVEAAELPNDSGEQQTFVFRISHAIHAAYSKSYQQKGALQIEALGGFYHLSIPITLVNKYDEETEIEEIELPPDVQPPTEEATPADQPPQPEAINPPSSSHAQPATVPVPAEQKVEEESATTQEAEMVSPSVPAPVPAPALVSPTASSEGKTVEREK